MEFLRIKEQRELYSLKMISLLIWSQIRLLETWNFRFHFRPISLTKWYLMNLGILRIQNQQNFINKLDRIQKWHIKLALKFFTSKPQNSSSFFFLVLKLLPPLAMMPRLRLRLLRTAALAGRRHADGRQYRPPPPSLLIPACSLSPRSFFFYLSVSSPLCSVPHPLFFFFLSFILSIVSSCLNFSGCFFHFSNYFRR